MRGKFEGCLLGLAIGDAMGAIGIGENKESLAQKYGKIRDLVGGGSLNLEPGEYGQNGQMAVSVLESICTLRSFKPDNVAYRFVGWLKSHPKKVDEYTAHVLGRVRDGESWPEASEAASYDSSLPTLSGAGLIYSIPVGLYRVRYMDHLIADTVACTQTTQWDRRCTHAAVAVNLAISLLVQNESGFLGKLFKLAREKKLDSQVQNAIGQAIENAENEEFKTADNCLSLLTAGLKLVAKSVSFEEGLLIAANLGGAAPDRLGALTGALLGARFGRLDLPERWFIQLVGRDRIEVLAARLSEHAS
jgi:ADP-ribosyl-[dinitrogen reductase] hydrolase